MLKNQSKENGMSDKKKSAETKEKIKDYAIGIGVATVATGNPISGVIGGVIGTAAVRKIWPKV